MRVLVCGSAPRVNPERPGWTDRDLLFAALDIWATVAGSTASRTTIIEGEAPGADKMAREWAEDRGATVEPYPANWSRGRAAGPIRNRQMLADGRPEVVLAFSTDWPLRGGTLDMVKLADRERVPVRIFTPDGRVRDVDGSTLSLDAGPAVWLDTKRVAE